MAAATIPTKILSIVLAVVCLFGLFGCLTNLKDVGNAKSYWEETGAEAEKSFNMLEDGITQLSDNEEAYTEGAEAYAEGLEEYEAGEKQVAEGEITLADGQKEYDAGEAKLIQAHKDYEEGLKQFEEGKQALEYGKRKLKQGKKDLEAGKKAYEAGKLKLEDGRREVAAGEAKLAAEKQNYEDGKAKLNTFKPIYAAAKTAQDALNEAKARQQEALNSGDLITAGLLEVEIASLQAALTTALAGYTMEGIIAEYEAGQALIKEYEDGLAKVEAGKAEIAQGEKELAQAEIDIANGEKAVAEGEAEIAKNEKKIYAAEKQLKDAKALLDENDRKLEEAKKALEEGAADLDAGREQVAQGAKDLAAGLEQLNLYEGGQLELAAGMDLAIATDTYYNANGEPIVQSIKDRLGEGFTYWTTNKDGKTILVNGVPFVDLDKAWIVCNTGRDFLADTSAAVTEELTGRILTIILTAAACIVGLVSAVFAFFGKKSVPFILSLVSAALAVFGVVMLAVKGTEMPLSRVAECGEALSVMAVLIPAAAVAAAHAIVVKVVKKKVEEPKPAEG